MIYLLVDWLLYRKAKFQSRVTPTDLTLYSTEMLRVGGPSF